MHMNGTLGYSSPIDENTIDRGDPYAAGAETIAPGIVEYAQQIRIVGEDLIGAIARIRAQVQMSDTQRQLLDMQIERARTGQPPLNLAQYGLGGATQPQMILGMTPQTLLIVAVIVALVLAARKG